MPAVADDVVTEIKDLKARIGATILAHYYQEGEIQELADFTGDSLQLARAATKVDTPTIVFCGVHFMAETAKILNPSKRVLLPDLQAGCSLVDGSDGSDRSVTATDDTLGQGVPAQCVVADPAGALILHPGSFTATERTRLRSITLDGPENLEVIEDSVADFGGPEGLQGVVLEYPPRANASFVDGLADWDSRRPLVGLVVRPHDGLQAVLVAVRLKDPDKAGHVRGVTIAAGTSEGPRTLEWEQLVLILPDGETCTDETVAETTEWTG